MYRYEIRHYDLCIRTSKFYTSYIQLNENIIINLAQDKSKTNKRVPRLHEQSTTTQLLYCVTWEG